MARLQIKQMRQTPQPELSVILNRVDDSKNPFSLRHQLFVTGYLFGKFKLSSPADFDTIFNALKTLPSSISQNLINHSQKLGILNKVAAKQNINLSKGFLAEIGELVAECGNNRVSRNAERARVEVEAPRREMEQVRKGVVKRQNVIIQKQTQREQPGRRVQKQPQCTSAPKGSIRSRNISKIITCPICLGKVEQSDLALLECQHAFHKKCVASAFKARIDQRRFPLNCPLSQCGKQMSIIDLEKYTQKDDLKRFNEYSLQKFVDENAHQLSWCPTPGCKYAFSFSQTATNFDCPVCNKSYCLKCRNEVHRGLSCEEFGMMRRDENDAKFIKYVQDARYGRCPNCRFWVERTEGCPHMLCRCNCEFCYFCGDTTGKCGC